MRAGQSRADTIEMADQTNKWDKLLSTWQQEGPIGFSLYAMNWALWKTRFYHALPGPSAENLQAFFRYAQSAKKFGVTEPIIVYQMGKVGSTTMVRSLQALHLNVPVYHLHFLHGAEQRETWARQTLRDPQNVLKRVNLSRRIAQGINRPGAPRYNLICMVRTPVPRNLSMFFENIDSYFPDWKARYKAKSLSFAELTDFFLSRYLDHTPTSWFESQIKQVFGLDVYATPFDKTRGYQFYENARARLVVLRLEDLNRVAAQAMREFLNIPNLQLVDSNIGETNPHGALYKEYLGQLRLPNDYIQETNGTQYARHFYTDQELARSVARWVSQ